jgi:hypothetical protein
MNAMKRMNLRRQTLARGFSVILVCLFFQGAAAEEPFNKDDLNRFLTNGVPFLDWVRTNRQEKVLDRLMDQPRSIAEFPAAVRFLQDHQWDPERFAYILNHVLVVYQRRGMGRDPAQLLAQLDETKLAVRADATQSESNKVLVLAMVESNQCEVRKMDKAFGALPPQEVRLMWFYRAELQQALAGHLPIHECVLPMPPKKP